MIWSSGPFDIRNKCFATLMVLGFVSGSAMLAHAALTPAALRCEYGIDPLGVDVARPRLYWELKGEGKDAQQSAYRVIVASNRKALDADEADLWDSGRIETNASTHIRYSGQKLTSSQSVYWKVKVWDAAGTESTWSPSATWTMGLLDATDWKGQWICAVGASEALLLRKEVKVKPGLKRALVHASGLGHYEMFLNGQKVGTTLLAPGWTDYNDTVLYDTFDVTSLLGEGSNAISMALGNGMYNVVRRNRFVKFTGSYGALRAIVHLQLEYADGSVEFLGSDATWRTNPGPMLFSGIYGGEDVDARLEEAGWKKPGFQDSHWSNAVVIVRPAGKLRGFTGTVEPIREIETRTPASVREIRPGAQYVYDFGQNASYMTRLTLSGPKGSTVRLIPAEIANPDGTIQRSTMGSTNRGISWWQYTKRTDEPETWFPQFYYVGCRFVDAGLAPATPDGPLPKIEKLEGVVVHASAAPIGEFSSSNPLLNRIRDLVRWAQRANMVSVLTDCPHREKLGWLEQYHLNGPAIRYEFDMARMFTKGMNDMAEAQLKNGFVPNIAPEFTEFDGSFRAAAEWGSAFILVPWQQYQFCADRGLLERHYPAMKRYYQYLESRATNNILSEGLGDWYDLGPAKPGHAQLTSSDITSTAFLFYDAIVMSDIASILGFTEDHEAFKKRSSEIRNAFNLKFFNAENGHYGTGSQAANALALALGIVEPDQSDMVVKRLVADVESRGFATTAGDVGFRFVLRALADNNRSDVIYKMVCQDTKPGYAYMLKKGATSLTESWDSNPNSSHNHFMLGQVTEWLYCDLAGIRPDPFNPGFKGVWIEPNPVPGLEWVKASYHSLHGLIRSEWENKEGRFRMRVTIPPNTGARVKVPGKGERHEVVGPGQHVFESAL